MSSKGEPKMLDKKEDTNGEQEATDLRKPEDKPTMGMGIPNPDGIIFTSLHELANMPDRPLDPNEPPIPELTWCRIEDWPDVPVKDPE